MQRFTSSVSSSSPRQQITATSTTILQLSKSNYVPKLYNHFTGIPRSVRVNIAKRSAEGTNILKREKFFNFVQFSIFSNLKFCPIFSILSNNFSILSNLSILTIFSRAVDLKFPSCLRYQFFVFCRSFLFEFSRQNKHKLRHAAIEGFLFY